MMINGKSPEVMKAIMADKQREAVEEATVSADTDTDTIDVLNRLFNVCRRQCGDLSPGSLKRQKRRFKGELQHLCPTAKYVCRSTGGKARRFGKRTER
jgi:hypothetical protein